MDHSIQVNLDSLAATIALASDALAAAAEALAEAARAMSDTSGTFENMKLAEAPSDIIRSSSTDETADPGNNLADGGFVDLLGPEDQCAPVSQQVESWSGHGVLAAGSRPSSTASISSGSDAEVKAAQYFPSQDSRPSGSRPPQPEEKIAPSQLHATPHELNNKLTLPLLPEPPIPKRQLPRFHGDGRDAGSQSNKFGLLETMNSYPRIPAGRNYIYFDQDSDGLAFMAYMALQVNRIICVVPDNVLSDYSSLLRSLTHAEVHCVDTPDQFTLISAALGPLEADYYDILCTPKSKFILNAPSFRSLYPDCILHWGVPASSYYYIALASLPHTTRNCIMEIGEYQFDGRAHGVEPYSEAVIGACFHPSSPFRPLRQMAFQLIPGPTPLDLRGGQSSKAQPYPDPSVLYSTSSPKTSQTQKGSSEPLPAGHYYAIIDNANEINFIPMITYIALKVSKAVCYIPPKESLDRYSSLIKLISAIDATVCSATKPKKIKVVVNGFKSKDNGILLRKATAEWLVCWGKSLADFLIYCGIPSDLPSYLDECRWKVSHSLLILTTTQYRSIRQRLNRLFDQHPYIGTTDDRFSPLIYTLQQKLVPHL